MKHIEYESGHEKWIIESDYLMCTDGFDRQYWRGRCECGETSQWRFWRSYAEDDKFAHRVDKSTMV